ncbi:MAG: hypothetical protein OXD32_01980 [Endozoicomonadaceae bacterium]|nr:hypothetical protein [Endozoicomonadaceae bacterium]
MDRYTLCMDRAKECAQNNLDKFGSSCGFIWQFAFDSAQATGLRWQSGGEASEIEVRRIIVILWID